MRAESSTPAMPITRSRGKPETRRATSHIASSGFDTITRIAFGERLATSAVTLPTISSFFQSRSSRLIPGLRGSPAVMTTMSEFSVPSYVFVPRSSASYVSTGAVSFMSSDFPCGTPSTMSTSTTSASSLSAIPCATVAPTLPAPTTVTFVFIRLPSGGGFYRACLTTSR